MEDILISAGTKLGSAALKMFASGKKPSMKNALGSIAGAALGDDGEDFEFGGDEEEAEVEEEYEAEEEVVVEEYDDTAYQEEQYAEEEAYQEGEETYYDESGVYDATDSTGEGYYAEEDSATYNAFEEEEATAYDTTYYEDPAAGEQAYTDPYGVTYDDYGNVVDDGSGYTYDNADDQYGYDDTATTEYDSSTQYEEPATYGQDTTAIDTSGSHRLGTGLAIGGAALAGAAVLGGAAAVAHRARGRGRARGAPLPARGRGAPGRAQVAPAPLRGAHAPQTNRGRGGPVPRGRGLPQQAHGRSHSQSFSAPTGMRLPPLKHASTAPAKVPQATVRGALARGRGAPARGRGRGGAPLQAGVQQQAAVQRGRGAVRSRGTARGGRQSQPAGRGRGAIASPTSPRHDAPVGGYQPPSVTPINTNVVSVSPQTIMGPQSTVGPLPGSQHQSPQIYGVTSPNSMGYMGQAGGVYSPNSGIGSLPPPPYYSVAYNTQSSAPTQRRAMDPAALQQISKRKLEALQRVQQKERERIEAKRREEEEDRERARGGADQRPQNIPEPKVQINFPPKAGLAAQPISTRPKEEPLSQELPTLSAAPNHTDRNEPQKQNSNVFTHQSKHSQDSNSGLGRTSSVLAPQVVEGPRTVSYTHSPAPVHTPNNNFYEMDGTGHSKPNQAFNNPASVSQNYNHQANFPPSQHNRSEHRHSIAELGYHTPISDKPHHAVEIGSSPISQHPAQRPQPPFHSSTWSGNSNQDQQSQETQQTNQGPQRSLSMLQRFPSRKPVQRPTSMIQTSSSNNNMNHSGYRDAGFNQPQQPPQSNNGFRHTYPQNQQYSQIGAGSRNSIADSEIAEEEQPAWTPPPVKAVRRRKFNSGEPVPTPEEHASEQIPDTISQKSVSPPPINNAFAPPPPPPSLPPTSPVTTAKKKEALPEPERKQSYFENMSPETEIPGLRVRKQSVSSIASTATTNISNSGYPAAHPQIQAQANGHNSTFVIHGSSQHPQSHDTSFHNSVNSSPAYTYASPQQGHMHHSNTFPSQNPHHLPHTSTEPLHTKGPHDNYGQSYQNQQFDIPQPPSHVMEMPASTGWATTRNTRAPYDMNPMIAELPEVPAPPAPKKQDLDQTGGAAAPMSANSVSFGWDYY